MKKIFVVIIFLTSQFAFSQTKIADKQEVWGKWSKSGSPYIIEGEAIVPAGKTLTIKPGTIIMFKTGEDRDYRHDGEINSSFDVGFLRVQGKIIANGKKGKMITFTANGEGNWGNVFLEQTDGNSFKFCKFEGSYYMRQVVKSDNGTGALSFWKSSGTVENCIFANNGWTAINCKQGSSPIIKNVTITMNNYGIECNSESTPEIISSIIYGNQTQFFVNGGSTPKISYCLIQDASMHEDATDLGKNIFGDDPQFNDEFKSDFSLKSTSPCRKTGKGGVNMGAVQ